MSSSSNSHTASPRAPAPQPPSTARRALLLAALCAPLLARSASAQASIAPYSGLRRWGSGSFRRLGFWVYDATLWAGDDPLRPPLALRLDYKRSIAGKVIAAASVKEMRRFSTDDAALLAWGAAMQRIFPDVQPGDHILVGAEGQLRLAAARGDAAFDVLITGGTLVDVVTGEPLFSFRSADSSSASFIFMF